MQVGNNNPPPPYNPAYIPGEIIAGYNPAAYDQPPPDKTGSKPEEPPSYETLYPDIRHIEPSAPPPEKNEGIIGSVINAVSSAFRGPPPAPSRTREQEAVFKLLTTAQTLVINGVNNEAAYFHPQKKAQFEKIKDKTSLQEFMHFAVELTRARYQRSFFDFSRTTIVTNNSTVNGRDDSRGRRSDDKRPENDQKFANNLALKVATFIGGFALAGIFAYIASNALSEAMGIDRKQFGYNQTVWDYNSCKGALNPADQAQMDYIIRIMNAINAFEVRKNRVSTYLAGGGAVGAVGMMAGAAISSSALAVTGVCLVSAVALGALFTYFHNKNTSKYMATDLYHALDRIGQAPRINRQSLAYV